MLKNDFLRDTPNAITITIHKKSNKTYLKEVKHTWNTLSRVQTSYLENAKMLKFNCISGLTMKNSSFFSQTEKQIIQKN